MLKRILLGCGLIILLLAVVEVFALLMLLADTKQYAHYWKQRAGEPGDFLYLALGNSAAQSIGASRPENGYVGLLAAQIEHQTGHKVRVVNLSVSGAKIQDLIDHQLPLLRQYRPDLISLDIGANDMQSYEPAGFQRQFAQVLNQLPADKTVVATIPFFGGRNHPGGGRALVANEHISKLTAGKGFAVADIYSPLKAAGHSSWIYAPDFFHPNDKGYRIWYDAFWKAVEPKLAKAD